MGIYVQYGCGLSCPDGWVNFDASPTLVLQRLPLVGALFRRGGVVFPAGVRYGDIVRGLPVADNTADGIYASHILEHLSRNDVERALANTIRMLKPGGVFRLVVPDLEARARRYLSLLEAGDAGGNDWLMRAGCLGAEQRPRGLAGFVRQFFGNSTHLWMWDESSMAAALRRAGFAAIRRCRFNDRPMRPSLRSRIASGFGIPKSVSTSAPWKRESPWPSFGRAAIHNSESIFKATLF
jgi:SAM-dependent methyltransferase